MSQFKKGVDLSRVFKKIYIPEVTKRATKNCKFSGKYYEDMTNCSTNYTVEEIPENNTQNINNDELDNNIFEDNQSNANEEALSSHPQFFSNDGEDEICDDFTMAQNIQETIFSIEKELKGFEKNDFNYLFEENDLDEYNGPKYLKIDNSGPGFGICIGDQSSFSSGGLKGSGFKHSQNFINKNDGCFFDSECISM